MDVAAYADDLVLIAHRRHAMLLRLNVRENYAERYNIMFSTDDDPRKSKNKCIFMVGKARNISLYYMMLQNISRVFRVKMLTAEQNNIS